MPDSKKRTPVSSMLRRDPATTAWILLIALTLASASAIGHGAHPLWRLAAAVAVALLCALKGIALVRGYLRPREAGPVFDRIVRLFAALAPTLLVITALLEAWRALAT